MVREAIDEPQLSTRVIERKNQPPVLQLRRGELKVTKGPDKGKKLTLPPEGLLIGTSSECELVLTDTSVSRKHAELRPAESGVILKDLGSKNGTFISGVRVEQAILDGGAEFVCGQTKLRLVVLEDVDEFPLSEKTSFGSLLGRSVTMRRIFALLERAAVSDAIVLLEGESGTGKDLAAEALHDNSKRAAGPFVVVDCGAIRSTLAESELFGHARGAYTGADADRPSVFEAGSGGTVFLDEIGELESPLQVKLLRVLEKREVKRLGENHYRPVDVRLIAATNRDLSAERKAGRFREDLFFRLSVVRVRMPGLRDRRDDIPLLARSFVQRLNSEADPQEVISDPVLAMFLNHDWPGNVRELRNVVERLMVFKDFPKVAISDSSLDQNLDPDMMKLCFHEARQTWNDRFEKLYLIAVLEATDWVVSKAAAQAGIPRQTFYRLMTKHRLVK